MNVNKCVRACVRVRVRARACRARAHVNESFIFVSKLQGGATFNQVADVEKLHVGANVNQAAIAVAVASNGPSFDAPVHARTANTRSRFQWKPGASFFLTWH